MFMPCLYPFLWVLFKPFIFYNHCSNSRNQFSKSGGRLWCINKYSHYYKLNLILLNKECNIFHDFSRRSRGLKKKLQDCKIFLNFRNLEKNSQNENLKQSKKEFYNFISDELLGRTYGIESEFEHWSFMTTEVNV